MKSNLCTLCTHALKTTILCYTILYSAYSTAQESTSKLNSPSPAKESFWRRVSVGGNLAFQVGNVTGITVAPEVAVRLVDNLYVGSRFVYQYFYYKDYFYDSDAQAYLSYKSNVFGGSLFLRYYLTGLFDNAIGNLFGHVEYEYLAYIRPYAQTNMPTSIRDGYGYFYTRNNETIEVNSFFIGGGYRQPVASRVSMDILILFNLNDTFNSPYANPVIRFGVGVGL
jgi:hypothetical protein